MVRTFNSAKIKDSTLTIGTYAFPFLYLHKHTALNHLTQPHGTQSSQLLDKLVDAGYLTEKALEYLVDRKETTKSSEPDTKEKTNWQNNIFKYIIITCVVGFVIGVSVLYYWHHFAPPK
tara:strand:- start:111 stop:467 length:357 start_codon:yes stop_codon:yes gene_type:complete